MKITFFSILVISICLIFSSAQAQQLVKTHGDWNVFTLQSKGEKMCYIASSPKKKSGTYNKRGEPYLIVTHRSKETDEVSASAGYPFKQGSTVQLSFDKDTKMELFTTVEVPEVSWAKDSESDKKIVAAMKKGVELTISGESREKSTSKDVYSLKGFTKAYQEMKKACK